MTVMKSLTATMKKMKRKIVPNLPPDEVTRIREMVPTVDELRIIDLMRDYRAIRNNYFGKTIPPVEEVLLRFLPRKEMQRIVRADNEDIDGISLWGYYLGSPVPVTIVLADDLRVNEIRITLIHEMAHLKVNIKANRSMKHGKTFEKELTRLRIAGAYDGWM